MNWLFLGCFLRSLLCISGVVKIVDFIGPTSVRNGTKSNLILDCSYYLSSENEGNGLEVKWFFNKVPYPIYQWIPGNKPQDLIFFKGRLDLQYEASDDPLSRYRAISIINPTIELTGDYTCWVSSFDSYDFKKQKIVIYSPATDISLTYSNPSPGIVAVICHSHGLYPEPEITLYRGLMSSERSRVDGVTSSIIKDSKKHTFNATVKFQFSESELLSEHVYVCVVNLLGTDYSIQEEILIYKDSPPKPEIEATSSGTHRGSFTPHLLMNSLILFLMIILGSVFQNTI